MTDKKEETLDRRGFFGAAAKGATLGLGAVVATVSTAQATEVEPSGDSTYRATPHVKTYYDLARF